MKDGQYFCVHDTDSENLIVGKVSVDKGDITLYANDDKCYWNHTAHRDTKDKSYSRYMEISSDISANSVEFYVEYKLIGFSTITEARYKELSKSKALRKATSNAILKKYEIGRCLNHDIKKIENKYVFGCGAVVLSKSEFKSLTSKMEKLVSKKERLDLIDDEISKLEEEKDSLYREIDEGFEEVDDATNGEMGNDGIDIETFDKVVIKDLKKLATL